MEGVEIFHSHTLTDSDSVNFIVLGHGDGGLEGSRLERQVFGPLAGQLDGDVFSRRAVMVAHLGLEDRHTAAQM